MRVTAVLAGLLAAWLATPYLPGAPADNQWATRTADVESHIRAMHAEIQTMFDRVCGASGAARVPSPWEQARALALVMCDHTTIRGDPFRRPRATSTSHHAPRSRS